MHQENDITQKVEEISQIKNINSPIFKFKLRSIFIRKNQITKYKKELAMLYEQKIDKNNKNHIQMLLDIWNRFIKNNHNINIIDQKWSKYIIIFIYKLKNIFINIAKIGFQNKDPLSDFRGMGLLGLRHLWYFSLYDMRSENVFNVATNDKTWYYYAACGINITGRVIQFIEGNSCEKYFYDLNEEINLYNFTQCLFNEFFVGFNSMWLQKNNFNLLMVNTYLEEFMEKKANNIFFKILLLTKKF